jgi:hypothetical protein
MKQNTFLDGDKVKYIKSGCLVNYGSIKDPKVGDTFSIRVENDLIGLKSPAIYYLINDKGEELMYPYKEYELNIYFEKLD